MSDIGKCRGVICMKMCEHRNRCRRFLEPSSPWMSWIAPEREPCEFFVKEREE